MIDHPRVQAAEVRITLNVAPRHDMTPARVSACSIAAIAAACALNSRGSAALMRNAEFDEFERASKALLLDALQDCGYSGDPDPEALCAPMVELQVTSTVQ